MTFVSLGEENLIWQYVAICNEALLENAHKFPFRQIMDASEKSASGRMVEARLIDNYDNNSFILTLKDRYIEVTPHSACRNCHVDYIWNIPTHYLEDVIRHPDQYISNPAKLDWDWLYRT